LSEADYANTPYADVDSWEDNVQVRFCLIIIIFIHRFSMQGFAAIEERRLESQSVRIGLHGRVLDRLG
jgi:hypothetical protein